MARRRYHQSSGDSPAELMVTAALECAPIGFALAVFLLIAALVFRAFPDAMFGMTKIISKFLLYGSAGIAFLSCLGLIFRRGGEIVITTGHLLMAMGRSIAALLKKDSTPDLSASHLAPPHQAPPRTSALSYGKTAYSRAPSARYERPSVHWPSPRRPQPKASDSLSTSNPGSAPSMLSKGENAFYLPLREIVAGRFEILIKPSLADVLQRRNDPKFPDIAKMHVDFLLCDIETLEPRLAIELDGRSHFRKRQQNSDAWKLELLTERCIPLMRHPYQAAYDIQELRDKIARATS